MRHVRKITHDQALEEYRRNAAFRKELATGCYVYVDGMYVLNHPSMVEHKQGDFVLTQYAMDYPSKCTLSFNVLEQKHGEYTFFDAPRVNLDICYDSAGHLIDSVLKNEVFDVRWKIINQLKHSTPSITIHDNAWDMIGHFIKFFDIKKEEFFDAVDFSDDDYRRAIGKRDEKDKGNASKIKIITFAAGYNFNCAMINPFLAKAKHPYQIGTSHDTLENSAYAYVLDSFGGRSLDCRNAFLIARGVPPLGTKNT